MYYREWGPLLGILSKIPTKMQRGLLNYNLNLTCVASHKRFLALGTDCGLVYWYDRQFDELMRLHLPSSSRSEITKIRLVDSVDLMLAVGDKSGVLTIFQISVQPLRGGKECFSIPNVHHRAITALCWSMNGHRLFSGDRSGLVTLTEIDFSLHTSSTTAVWTPADNEEDNEILQLSYVRGVLLVSTRTKTFIIHINDPSNRQIELSDSHGGLVRPLRDFGKDFQVVLCRPENKLSFLNKDLEEIYIQDFDESIKKPHYDVPLINPVIFSPFNETFSSEKFSSIEFLNEKKFVVYNEHSFHIIDETETKVIASCRSLRQILDLSTNECDDEIFILEGPRSLVRIAPSMDPFEDNYKHKNLNPLGTEVPEKDGSSFDFFTTLVSDSTSAAAVVMGKFFPSNDDDNKGLQTKSVLPKEEVVIETRSESQDLSEISGNIQESLVNLRLELHSPPVVVDPLPHDDEEEEEKEKLLFQKLNIHQTPDPEEKEVVKVELSREISSEEETIKIYDSSVSVPEDEEFDFTTQLTNLENGWLKVDTPKVFKSFSVCENFILGLDGNGVAYHADISSTTWTWKVNFPNVKSKKIVVSASGDVIWRLSFENVAYSKDKDQWIEIGRGVLDLALGESKGWILFENGTLREVYEGTSSEVEFRGISCFGDSVLMGFKNDEVHLKMRTKWRLIQIDNIKWRKAIAGRNGDVVLVTNGGLFFFSDELFEIDVLGPVTDAVLSQLSLWVLSSDHIYRSRKVLGHLWKPGKFLSRLRLRDIVGEGIYAHQGVLWAFLFSMSPVKELHFISPFEKTWTLTKVGLPKEGGSPVVLSSTPEATWLLLSTGAIYIRKGIKPGVNPSGNSWVPLDLSQLKGVTLVHLSLGGEEDVVWALDSDGASYIRLGSLQPPPDSLLPAWIPLGNEIPELDPHGRPLRLVKIYTTVKSLDQVWALDNQRNVYFRDGVTLDFRPGTSWKRVDLQAVELSVSPNFVWALTSEGKIYFLRKEDEIWNRIPGDDLVFSALTASVCDHLFVLDNRGRLVEHRMRNLDDDDGSSLENPDQNVEDDWTLVSNE